MAYTACPAPLVMSFFRQEDWSGLPFPSPGDLPNPVIEPGSPTLQADFLSSEPQEKPREQVETCILTLWSLLVPRTSRSQEIFCDKGDFCELIITPKWSLDEEKLKGQQPSKEGT